MLLSQNLSSSMCQEELPIPYSPVYEYLFRVAPAELMLGESVSKSLK